MLSTRPTDPGSAAEMPGTDDVRAQLERILSSPEFPCAGRAPAFLRYVVDETLAGRASRIKGYSIAIEVFGRDQTFTQDDPVVRIEAGRLRRSLERYYLVEGDCDPVRIDIPKGGYAPVFSWNQTVVDAEEQPIPARLEPTPVAGRWSAQSLALAGATALLAACLYWIVSASWVTGGQRPGQIAGQVSEEAPAQVVGQPTSQSMGSSGRPLTEAVHGMPTLAVVPFTNLDGGLDARLFSLGLTEELLTALPRFREIKVFGGETSNGFAADVDVSSFRTELGARYLLAGGVRASSGRLRVTARLLATADGEILWSKAYDEALVSADRLSVQREVARRIATAIAQPYGIMMQVDAAKWSPADPDANTCMLGFYAYRSEPSAEAHAGQRDCLKATVAQHPTHASAWAMLSIIYLDEARFKFNVEHGVRPPTERALIAARRATQLDGNNTRALQALMMALFSDREPGEALRVGEQALGTNPDDTELIGEFGTTLALAGQWRRGADLLDQAISLNPAAGDDYHGMRALAAFMLDDKEIAVQEIARANRQKSPFFHAVAAVVYAQAGMIEKARFEGQILASNYPDFVAGIDAEFIGRNLQPDDRFRLLAGLRTAGLPLPQQAADAVDPSGQLPR